MSATSCVAAAESHKTTAFAPARQGLWLAVVVLTALNLRPFLTAIGPLASDIADATGLDLRGMAWLTLLPMLLSCCCMPMPVITSPMGPAPPTPDGARGAAGAGMAGAAAPPRGWVTLPFWVL